MAQPIGIRYEGPQTRREHQTFPGEYFSGCDVSIYFGDLFIDEITGIEFTMSENVRPIYGYASKTWDAFARGTRMVHGRFRMSFKESAYLHSVFEHLNANESKPDLNLAPSDAIPVWMQRAQNKIDNTLAQPRRTTTETKEHDWPDLRFGSTDIPGGDQSVLQLKTTLRRLGYEMPVARFDWPLLQIGMRDSGSNTHIAQLQSRLDRFLMIGIFVPGEFDTITHDAVIEFQQACGLPTTGQVNDITRILLGGDTDTMLSPVFETNTMFAVRLFQSDNSIDITGIVDAITRRALSPTIEVVLPPEEEAIEAIDYEKTLWNNEQQEPFHRKYFPYFYTSRMADGDQTELLKNGFNIHIVFGPLQHAPENNGTVPFSNTIRTLWGVQLGNVSVAMDASGRPIEEIYDFYAQDFE